jgi:hypothetical protein
MKHNESSLPIWYEDVQVGPECRGFYIQRNYDMPRDISLPSSPPFFWRLITTTIIATDTRVFGRRLDVEVVDTTDTATMYGCPRPLFTTTPTWNYSYVATSEGPMMSIRMIII